MTRSRYFSLNYCYLIAKRSIKNGLDLERTWNSPWCQIQENHSIVLKKIRKFYLYNSFDLSLSKWSLLIRRGATFSIYCIYLFTWRKWLYTSANKQKCPIRFFNTNGRPILSTLFKLVDSHSFSDFKYTSEMPFHIQEGFNKEENIITVVVKWVPENVSAGDLGWSFYTSEFHTSMVFRVTEKF